MIAQSANNVTVPTLQELPGDFLYVLRQLILHQQFATAAKLMRCSKTFFDLFEPVVDYSKLTISRRNAKKNFWGLMSCEWCTVYFVNRLTQKVPDDSDNTSFESAPRYPAPEVTSTASPEFDRSSHRQTTQCPQEDSGSLESSRQSILSSPQKSSTIPVQATDPRRC